MSSPSSETPQTLTEATETTKATEATETTQAAERSEPKPTYVKLAMRNMVRKRGTSLFHFALTAVGLLGVMIGLSYLTR